QDVLECAPRGQYQRADAQIAWQRALLEKVLRCVSMIRGYEALHASAVDSPEGVVAFLGAGGAGKTTLALEFMRRGWPLFGEEVLTLGRRAAGVSAFRGTPHMSISSRPLSTARGSEPGARITRGVPARTSEARGPIAGAGGSARDNRSGRAAPGGQGRSSQLTPSILATSRRFETSAVGFF